MCGLVPASVWLYCRVMPGILLLSFSSCLDASRLIADDSLSRQPYNHSAETQEQRLAVCLLILVVASFSKAFVLSLRQAVVHSCTHARIHVITTRVRILSRRAAFNIYFSFFL